MKNRILATTLATVCLFQSCSTQQVMQTVGEVGKTILTPSNTEVIGGLKEALKQGVGTGTDFLSKTDGFWGNAALKILLPPEAKNIETKLRAIGMGDKVDKAIKALNTGAEKAVFEAKPIFVDAITGMSFSDAMNILKGGNGAATSFLKQSTSDALRAKFSPIIQNSLNQVGATKYWADVVNAYNLIPLVQKMNPDLNGHVTEKAMSALFSQIEKEENDIRSNPAKRGTDLLKKVFSYADSNK